MKWRKNRAPPHAGLHSSRARGSAKTLSMEALKKSAADVRREIEAEIEATAFCPDALSAVRIGKKILAAVAAYPEAPELAGFRSLVARGLEQYRFSGKPN